MVIHKNWGYACEQDRETVIKTRVSIVAQNLCNYKLFTESITHLYVLLFD